ncbi:hypothetical protein [Streptomyces alkaliterrae]|uniref:Secreted protein n=1 Tax=Streptomyces alkaliterrae TaxID=2213162 RepID=A0A5P0YVY1_9ACTN|nr:hypothetical protein [Streptomyces alkaliterrae]MBB1252811.1 hypothetical protein [Streptomyces alkaliterrae]MBB1259055.1 hypothetical protein [Streptomyces alkaliterrae]MQS04455.1 hypothetical protein [Streptomyces alkaliterrae]
MRTKRTRRTLSAAGVAAIGLGLTLAAGPAAQASGPATQAASCQDTYKGTVESSAVKATVWVKKCSDGKKSAWGTLWDKKADSRSAYLSLDTHGYGVISFRNSKGSGTSIPYSTPLPSETRKLTAMVRACNTWTCGDSASRTYYV